MNTQNNEINTTEGKTGFLFLTSKGDGYFRPEDREDETELFIPFVDTNTALHKDKVVIVPVSEKEGKVVQVVERHKSGFSARVKKDGDFAFAIADDSRMLFPIILPDYKGSNNDWIFITIDSWTPAEGFTKEHIGTMSKSSNLIPSTLSKVQLPSSMTITPLNEDGGHKERVSVIAMEYGFPLFFPESIEKEAHEIKAREKEIFAEAEKVRRDMRGTPTCTIDPADAKDFDDALSFKALPDGTYEIGIHIADVSHYVKPGTALDTEAFKRGTSVYLVDRTIPMLPEVLSNDLCSLMPNVDRLCVSAIMIINSEGKVLEEWFGKTIIHSDQRFSYEEAQELIMGKDGEYAETLRTMNEIAKKLTQKRFEGGALSLETDEVKFRLDEMANPLEVYVKQRFDAHKMIEEYMLLANKHIARHLSGVDDNKEHTMIYRIHDEPTDEKMQDLMNFLKDLDIPFKEERGRLSVPELQRILKDTEDHVLSETIGMTIIRTMQKAVYSVKNSGHFGLGFTYYTHFTSPIRRYPDLVVHRILEEHTEGNPPGREFWDELNSIALHTSETEGKASRAERESISYMQAVFMSKNIGKEYVATITHMTERGFFAEEGETRTEGFVRPPNMGKGYFSYNKSKKQFEDYKNKVYYKLGNKVTIKIDNVNIAKRQIDYSVVQTQE
ncbi:MAG: ribonuclease R [Flavobacteriaceae bacterium]|jgi:ribonuclease R